MNTFDEKQFNQLFNTLSESQQNMLLSTMRKMEHIKEPIDISFGIMQGRLSKGYSVEGVLKKINEKNNITDTRIDNKSTYYSMMERNSMKSTLYKDVLEVLEIDENFIEDQFYINTKLTPYELYSKLTERNQNAIIFLIENINTQYDTGELLKSVTNVGISKENDEF